MEVAPIDAKIVPGAIKDVLIARSNRQHMERRSFVAEGHNLLAAIVDGWRRDLTREKFSVGCPLVAAAADAAASSSQLRDVLHRAFDEWLEPLSESLAELGVPVERSDSLALVTVAALEGAIILARVRHDLTPFDALVRELGPLLDAVAAPAASDVPANG